MNYTSHMQIKKYTLKQLGPLVDGDWILTKNYSLSGIRLLQVGDVGIGEFVGKSSRYISYETARELGCTLLAIDDILISRMPDPIGRACQLPDLGYDAITAVDVSIWRPDPTIADRKYLVYLLSSQEWFERVKKLASGATRPRISRSVLENLAIPLPPLDEQRRIASRLNEQLAAVESARKAAEEQLQAAWELPSAYSREVFESIENSLPKTWRWVRLADVCQFKRGPFGGSLKKDIFVSSGYKVYEQQHAIRDNFEIGRYYITEDKYKEMEVFAIKPNDLIVSCSGTMGRIAIVPPSAEPGIINQALLKLTPNLDLISSSYLRVYLQSENVQKKHFLVSSGTAIQNVAPVSELKQIRVPLPSLPEQEVLVNALQDKIRSSKLIVEMLESQLAEIESLPASLLREAFAGQL